MYFYLLLTALMKVVFWLLHPDPNSRATLKDLRKDKWTNQTVDIALYTFESVLGEREREFQKMGHSVPKKTFDKGIKFSSLVSQSVLG